MKVTEFKDQVYPNLKSKIDGRRYVIGVSGIPGSGKTTFVKNIVDVLNQEFGNEVCLGLSMDGFHLPKSELDAAMTLRRGAHYTFDANKFLDFLSRLKTTETLTAPSFDHKIGDPVEDDVVIEAHHKIVIVEGIYLHLLNPPPWDQVSKLFDEKWYIPIDLERAKTRLAKRHFESNLADSIKGGLARFENNDKLNAEFILNNRDKNVLVVDINE